MLHDEGHFRESPGHPIVTNGDFVAQLRESARTDRAAIWVVSGVGPGFGVLDGVHILSRGREGVGGYSGSLVWIFVVCSTQRIQLLCEKFITFPHVQYVKGIIIKCAF